ncbi:MAG: hypothetical protein V5A68_07055, partial [Candidatus Thermoplasmatota archaeon]
MYRKTICWKVISVSIIAFLLASVSFSSAFITEKKENNFVSNDEKKFLVRDSGFTVNKFIGRFLLKNPGVLNNGYLTGSLETVCEGVEKTTSLSWGSYKKIDVDNNESTGINGYDINVQHILTPWINPEPFGIGILFTIGIERLGEGIKNKNFTASFSTWKDEVTLGYSAPEQENNQVPKSVRITFMVLLPIFQRNKGFSIAVLPEYEDQTLNENTNHLVLKTGYKDKQFSIKFEPAIETQLNVFSKKRLGEWRYEFVRGSSQPSKVTTIYEREQLGKQKKTTFTVDELPKELSFDLFLTPFKKEGGHLFYNSS